VEVDKIRENTQYVWEQRKLGELVTIERGGSPRPIDAYITDAQNGLNWVKIGDAPEQGRYITHTEEKIKPSGLSKTRQVFPGDLILSNSMSFGKPYIMGIPGCIHDGWLLIRNNQNVFDLKFLCQMLGTNQMLTQYKQLAAGSTVNNLNKGLVANAIVKIPKKDEQEQMGVFLEAVDNIITLHQWKSYELEKMRKITWEQRKVGDYLTESREIGNKGNMAHKLTVKLWGKGVYEKFESGSANTQYFIRHANQFIYSKLDFLNCAFGVVPEELDSFETTADVPAFDCVDMNPYFIFYRAIQPSFFIKNGIIANGSRKAKRIHADTFLEMPISVPSLTEQNKIVEHFQFLDRLITLHQRQQKMLDNSYKYVNLHMKPAQEAKSCRN